jgi:DNA-binding ferritin-like protein
MNNSKTLYKKRVKTLKKSKTYKNKDSSGHSSSHSLASFQKDITMKFFEMILMIKLFHWKTHSYATHKATDELYSKFNEHMDKFIEVLLGKTGTRIELTKVKNISLFDLNRQEQLIEKVNNFKEYLVSLDINKALSSMLNTDLFNIRDEILGDMNQFLYLLTFK